MHGRRPADQVTGLPVDSDCAVGRSGDLHGRRHCIADGDGLAQGGVRRTQGGEDLVGHRTVVHRPLQFTDLVGDAGGPGDPVRQVRDPGPGILSPGQCLHACRPGGGDPGPATCSTASLPQIPGGLLLLLGGLLGLLHLDGQGGDSLLCVRQGGDPVGAGAGTLVGEVPHPGGGRDGPAQPVEFGDRGASLSQGLLCLHGSLGGDRFLLRHVGLLRGELFELADEILRLGVAAGRCIMLRLRRCQGVGDRLEFPGGSATGGEVPQVFLGDPADEGAGPVRCTRAGSGTGCLGIRR